jgi:hypothetical protein
LQEQLVKQKETLAFNAISLAELESRLETADDRIEDLTRQIAQLESETEQQGPPGHALDVFGEGNETSRTPGGDLDDNESTPAGKVPGSPVPDNSSSNEVPTLRDDEKGTTDYMSMKADHAKTLAELAIIKAQYQETLLNLAKISAQLPPKTSEKMEADIAIEQKKDIAGLDDAIVRSETAGSGEKITDERPQETKTADDEEDRKKTAQTAQGFQSGRGKSKAHSSRYVIRGCAPG